MLVGKSREATDDLLNRLYAERAHNGASHRARYQWRVNLQKAEDIASYAGMITMPNQTSQSYQGTSLVWFPSTQGSLLILVIGTEGFGADQELLGRPNQRHRENWGRPLNARRYLDLQGRSNSPKAEAGL